MFSWPPQLSVLFLIFKPRITSQPSEKVLTEMTEEMLHVLQSVFAEVFSERAMCYGQTASLGVLHLH